MPRATTRSLSRNVGQGRRFKCTTVEENRRRTRLKQDARARVTRPDISPGQERWDSGINVKNVKFRTDVLKRSTRVFSRIDVGECAKHSSRCQVLLKLSDLEACFDVTSNFQAKYALAQLSPNISIELSKIFLMKLQIILEINVVRKLTLTLVRTISPSTF